MALGQEEAAEEVVAVVKRDCHTAIPYDMFVTI